MCVLELFSSIGEGEKKDWFCWNIWLNICTFLDPFCGKKGLILPVIVISVVWREGVDGVKDSTICWSTGALHPPGTRDKED